MSGFFQWVAGDLGIEQGRREKIVMYDLLTARTFDNKKMLQVSRSAPLDYKQSYIATAPTVLTEIWRISISPSG